MCGSRKNFPPASIGDTETVPVPDVDRGRIHGIFRQLWLQSTTMVFIKLVMHMEQLISYILGNRL